MVLLHALNAAERRFRRTAEQKDAAQPRPGYTSHASTETAMHYDAHKPVIDDLQARILTIRDSL